jgi:hypothetical protein
MCVGPCLRCRIRESERGPQGVASKQPNVVSKQRGGARRGDHGWAPCLGLIRLQGSYLVGAIVEDGREAIGIPLAEWLRNGD